MNNLHIYKASAGSGKTHLLSQNFLKLAFENKDNFSKILAVTFTNKAAEEMKTRIIEEINNIIRLGKKAVHFNEIKKHLKNKNDTEIITAAKEIRDNILHNYTMFSVSTIDSFVQNVIRSFSYEINVSSNYTLELDTEKVIKDLTELLYNEITENKELQKWLIKFADYKLQEGKNWDFRREIGNLAYEIFKEKFQSIYSFSYDANKEIKNTENKEKINKLLSEIYKIKTDFENKMNKISEKAEKILEKAGIDNSVKLGRNFGTITNYLCNKIKNKDYQPVKTVYNALDGLHKWHAKTADKFVVSIISSVYENLYELLEKSINEYEKNHSSYLSAKNTILNIHSFGILNDIADLLPEYRHENNLLLISDTTLLLKEIIGNNDAPFIYEKIGNKFKHILIDEFQDTSGFQWFNFQPLIKNSLSEAMFNMIVGDVKQSIYRWRGGDWKLLLNEVKKAIGEFQTEEKSLDTNWRSKKNIIDFNNSLFKNAVQIIQNQYNKELETIGDEEILQKMKIEKYNSVLNDAYSDSYQFLPNLQNKKGGRVKINFIKSSGRGNSVFKETLTELLPETINNLLKNKNYEARDIAILVRTNLQGKEAVDMILDYQRNTAEALNYDIISADSLFVSNSSGVKILVSALKFIYDERDKIELTKLIYEYQNIKNQNSENLHGIFTAYKNINENKNLLPQEFLQNTDLLRKKSLYELSEELIKIFGLINYKKTYPYLRTFQDIISDFTRKESSDLPAFLNWWDETGIKKSIQLSDKQNAVKIMTIHKSKGLAFTVVIVPFANWNIDHNSFNAPLIWANSKEKPFNLFEFLPVKYKSELADTVFRKDYFDEKLYAYMDALNMMYVAFTRPVEELIVFAPLKEKINKILKISDLLYLTINSENQEIKQGKKEYTNLKKFYNETNDRFESNENYEEKDEKKYIKIQSKNEFTVDNYPNNDWSEKLKIKYHSDDFFIESIEYIAEKVNYGKLMHSILAKIKTSKDIDNALQEMLFSGYISKEEHDELNTKIREIIVRPQVSEWFSDKWEVINENAIISRKGELKIPDRVLINKNNIIVIDFKFGKERKEHENQIIEYKKLLEDIYAEKVKAYLYYAEKDLRKCIC